MNLLQRLFGKKKDKPQPKAISAQSFMSRSIPSRPEKVEDDWYERKRREESNRNDGFLDPLNPLSPLSPLTVWNQNDTPASNDFGGGSGGGSGAGSDWNDNSSSRDSHSSHDSYSSSSDSSSYDSGSSSDSSSSCDSGSSSGD